MAFRYFRFSKSFLHTDKNENWSIFIFIQFYYYYYCYFIIIIIFFFCKRLLVFERFRLKSANLNSKNPDCYKMRKA